MKTIASAWVVFGTVALAGCGSSGGGGSTASAPPAVEQGESDFTSFSEYDLKEGEVLEIPAVSRETSYTVDSNGNVQVAEVSGAETGATNTFTGGPLRDGEPGEPASIVITSAGGTEVVFKPSDDPNVFMSRNIDAGFDTGYQSDSPALMIDFTEPKDSDGSDVDILLSSDFEVVGWDYQGYGVWITGLGTQGGTTGAFSGGAFTAGADIPTTGNAEFTGLSQGTYVDSTGKSFLTASNMKATASFANRTVNFQTTNTHTAPTEPTVQGLIARTSYSYTANAGLDLTGKMNYDAGTNQLNGQVQTADGMKGEVDANFYGPGAAEIGGSFAVKGTAGNYIGAFGGAK